MSIAASAQVVDTSDEDPAPAGSLRSEVEGSTPGEVIDVRLGSEGGLETIELRTVLDFDNDVELDNSSTDTANVDIAAPAAGTFLTIRDGVDVVLRDLSLIGNGLVSTDDIEFQGTTGSLTLDYEREDQLLAVDVLGAGQLIKEGSASLELVGVNTFSGGLTIVEGDVIGLVRAFGTGTIDLAPTSSDETARLIFGAGDDTLGLTGPAITDSRSGGGLAEIVKRGTGTLDIRAANIAAGLSIMIEEGVVRAGAPGLTDGLAFDVASGATLELWPATTVVTSASRLTGAGAIAFDANDLTLTADPSGFTGAAELSSASNVTFEFASAPSGALSFDVSIEDVGSTLVFDDAAGITFGGAISGLGEFTKAGSGTTTLTGANTYVGTTHVTAGTLVGSTSSLPADIELSSGADLVFRQDGDGRYADVISSLGGGSTVQKSGAGVLTLALPQTFVGAFEVVSGGLFLEAAAELTNASLRIGTGNGSSPSRLEADFDVDAGAIPGVSPETNPNYYRIGGALTIESDAEVRVGLGATTDLSTRYAATGAVSIGDGASLLVDAAAGTYDGSLTWDVLTGSGVSEVGAGFDIQQSLFFFTISGGVVGNTYQLSLSPNTNTFASAATTANARTIGAQLDAFRVVPVVMEPEIEAYQSALTSAATNEIDAILESVSPDDIASSTHVQLASAGRTWRGLSNRLLLRRRNWVGTRPDEGRGDGRTSARTRRAAEADARVRPSVAAGPVGSARRDEETNLGWNAWLEGGGALGTLESNDAKDIDYASAGPILGADRMLTSEVLVGFAVSGSVTNYETESGDGKGDGGSVEGTAYAGWLGDPLQLVGGFRYARAWTESERTIRVGPLAERAKGDLDGDVFGVFLELTRGFDTAVESGGVEIAPLASVTYTRVMWDAFDENGSSPLRVQFDEQNVDSVATSLGLRVSAERKMEEGTIFRPRFKALWNHEWAEAEREVAGRFASDSVTMLGGFTVEGAELPRDLAEIGVGWEVGFTPNANLFFDWEGRFGPDLVENAFSLGGRVAW